MSQFGIISYIYTTYNPGEFLPNNHGSSERQALIQFIQLATGDSQSTVCYHNFITYLLLSNVPQQFFSEMLYSLEWDLKRHAKSVFKIQYASLRLVLSLWPLQYCLHNYIAVRLAVLSGDSILFDWVPETHPVFTPGLASIQYEQRNTL